MYRSTSAGLIWTIACLHGAQATAQSAPEGWQLGAIGVFDASPLIGDDLDVLGLPFVAYRTEQYSIGLNGARYTVLDHEGQSVAFVLAPRFSQIDDDEAEFAGMDRDIALDFGVAFAQTSPSGFSVAVTALADVTDAHAGQEIDLRFSHRMSGLPLSVYAGATWQSDGLTEYLYGVRSDETAAGRPAFSPGAAITPYIGVSGAFPVTDQAAIIGSIEVRQLPDDITDSPIVDQSSASRATIGVVFNF
ncbi:MAG: MipA/OmpV family protein [Pseudomonadota bacterium]